MSIRLSILIPTVHTRRNTFLPKIQDEIFRQIDLLDEDHQKQVEVLVMLDNKTRMLGSKRNDLVSMCQGEYYVFVDDDDRIAPTYVSELLSATSNKSDVITFIAEVSINGGEPKNCIYSKDFGQDHNTDKAYNRLPNHICAVRRDVGIKVSFPNIKYGEDSAYSKILKPLLRTQHHIAKVLYYYDFNQDTTETQEHLRNSKPVIRDNVDPIVDVVILSNAKDVRLYKMTQKAIDTCINGANGLRVNIIVIEQNSSVKYNRANTIHLTDKFNYNGFANYGANRGKAKWIMVANNDLVFTDGWLHNLLSANHELVSPKCPSDIRQRDITENTTGDVNGKHMSGWCFMISRELWINIGGFDTCVSFWFSDDVTIEQCKANGVLPMLVPSSIVHHLGSTTLRQSQAEHDDYTWGQVDVFNTKYNKDKFIDHPQYRAWKEKQKEVLL